MKIKFKETRLIYLYDVGRNDIREFSKDEVVSVTVIHESPVDVDVEFEDGSRADQVPKEWFEVLEKTNVQDLMAQLLVKYHKDSPEIDFSEWVRLHAEVFMGNR